MRRNISAFLPTKNDSSGSAAPRGGPPAVDERRCTTATPRHWRSASARSPASTDVTSCALLGAMKTATPRRTSYQTFRKLRVSSATAASTTAGEHAVNVTTSEPSDPTLRFTAGAGANSSRKERSSLMVRPHCSCDTTGTVLRSTPHRNQHTGMTRLAARLEGETPSLRGPRVPYEECVETHRGPRVRHRIARLAARREGA